MSHPDCVNSVCYSAPRRDRQNVTMRDHAGAIIPWRPKQSQLHDVARRFARVRCCPPICLAIEPVPLPPSWVIAGQMKRDLVCSDHRLPYAVGRHEGALHVNFPEPKKLEMLRVKLTPEGASSGKITGDLVARAFALKGGLEGLDGLGELVVGKNDRIDHRLLKPIR